MKKGNSGIISVKLYSGFWNILSLPQHSWDFILHNVETEEKQERHVIDICPKRRRVI
jgi:hypothetical protein